MGTKEPTMTATETARPEIDMLADRIRRGEATGAEIARHDELARTTRGVACPPARTIWDLADRRDGFFK